MSMMDNFLRKRSTGFVKAWEDEQVDSYIEDDGMEVVYGGTLEVFGYAVIENTFEGISVEGDNITMGDKNIVVDVKTCYSSFPDCDMKGKLPIRYCVRTRNMDYAEFECGLDLCRNGMIWVGLENRGMFFDTINSAFKYLKDRLGEFEIHTEEPMKGKL